MRNISFSPPDITDEEISSVIDTLKSGWITTGPKTKLFEDRVAQFIGAPKAVALNSCTSSLELTLRLLGVGPGDEVITTTYTYTATAAVIAHVGAKIVFVDTAPDTFSIDYDQVEKAITEKTKVIIPVDIAGKMCSYNTLIDIVERKKHLFKPNQSNRIQKLFNRVIVLADSAHGFGSSRNGIKSGLSADFTAFSFHAVKTITSGEGGAVVWKEKEGLDNEWLYRQYMLYSLHGQSKDAYQKCVAGGWEYDIIYPGYKCNMTDTLASIGLVQLDRLEHLQNRRLEIIKKYDKALDEMGVGYLHHVNDHFITSCHIYLTRVPGIGEKERNVIITKMAEMGVACNVHFKPLPMMTAYKNLGFDIKDFPNAYDHFKNEITLPLHTLLSDEDVDYVIQCFKKALQG